MIAPLLALGLPGMPETLLLILLTAVLILPFWLILKKAGFHPAISLLAVFPVFAIFILFFLAFAPWPKHKK